MANLKEIRNRISSVKSTMQITSAMKMVSAAKLKKAQDAITAMRPYSEKLSNLLQNLSAGFNDDIESVYTQQKEVNKVLIVAITSNRGLCGAFNANVIKEASRLVKKDFATKEVSFVTIGKKGNDILSKKYPIQAVKNDIFDELSFENTVAITEELMQLFAEGSFDKVLLVYNSFKNAATQVVKTENFLPIHSALEKSTQNKEIDYIFEPSKVKIIKQLIPKLLKTQLYKAIRDSFASEHGARMTAMHKATDNAEALRDELTLTYNKARQAAITNEILEIVSGAEALNDA